MKNLELQNFGVVEMNNQEMEEVTGGGFLGALIGFVVCAVGAILTGDEFTREQWLAVGLAGAAIGAGLPI